LSPAEPLRYLLYCPIWEGNKAPFGIHAEPASHAVAVVDNRFLISHNPHIAGIEPTLRVVPFDTVLMVELGTAHLLGWFSVQFAADGQLSRISMLFRSVGIEHFAAAVREYRIADWPQRQSDTNEPAGRWKPIWQRVPLPQAGAMKPVVTPGERPAAVIRTSQTWGVRRRLWKETPVCLACDGVLIATDRGLLYAADEPEISPDMRSYGVNVSCVPRRAIAAASIRQDVQHRKALGILRLELGRGGISAALDVPFDERITQRVTALARQFGLDTIHDR
jgi:hypothetical protein